MGLSAGPPVPIAQCGNQRVRSSRGPANDDGNFPGMQSDKTSRGVGAEALDHGHRQRVARILLEELTHCIVRQHPLPIRSRADLSHIGVGGPQYAAVFGDFTLAAGVAATRA